MSLRAVLVAFTPAAFVCVCACANRLGDLGDQDLLLLQKDLRLQSLPVQPEKRDADYALQLPEVDGGAILFACSGGERQEGITNPSIVMMPQLGEVWLTFRLLSRRVDMAEWYSVPIFGRAPLTELGNDAPWVWDQFGTVSDFRLEGHPNATTCLDVSARGYTEGAEDPRLFAFNGSTYMMIIGTEVVPCAEEGISFSHPQLNNILGDAARLRAARRPQCENFGAHPYVAEILSVEPTVSFGPSKRLHFAEDMYVEKNWSPFTWEPAGQEPKLMMVYSVYPHTIVQVDPSTGNSHIFSSQTFAAVEELAKSAGVKATDLHGGSGVARVENSGQPYNVAVLHVRPDYMYRNWPYKFSTEPPFEIIAIGRELFLARDTWAAIRFVSSIAVHNNSILIGYGLDDAASRIWAMGLAEFEEQFFS